MKPRKPIARSTKRIRSRGKQRFKAGRDPEWCEFIRTLPCIFATELDQMCAGVVQCCHVKSRGAAGVDRGNTVPMCALHHTIQHTIGKLTFERRFNVNLSSIAAGLAA